jgi:hypothetical protein
MDQIHIVTVSDDPNPGMPSLDDYDDDEIVALATAAAAPSSSSNVPVQVQASARPPAPSVWTGDVELHNPVYEDGKMAVYVPPAETHDAFDKAANQAAMSSAAITYVRSMFETFKGATDNFMSCVSSVIGLNDDELEKMDETSIAQHFSGTTDKITCCVQAIIADTSLAKDVVTRVVGLAHNLIARVKMLEDVTVGHYRLKKATKSDVEPPPKTSDELSWLSMPVQIEDPNVLQQLYVYAMKEVIKYGYGRYGDGLMRRVVTSEGLVTNAWEKQCTFKEFVRNLTSIADSNVFKWSTSNPGIVDNVAKMMEQNKESWIPWIKPDRHVFAFSNGCYLAKDEMFIPFTAGAPPKMPGPVNAPLPTACKYHDMPVDPEWCTMSDPYKIKTPIMDMIMDTQRLSEGVKRCYFSMLGRGIYDLGEIDNWQVALFIKGQAETGKSTLLKFIQSWYNIEDVATLSSNIESTFGASMLVGKYIVVGDDLGEGLTLDQQLFQNMVSGNDVSLAKKNSNAINIRWCIPFLLTGNLLPGYKDNGGGSYSRRLFIISYCHPVIKVNPELPKELQKELAASIIKCNRLYRNMERYISASVARGVTFWEAIPEDFKLEKLNAMQSSNPLMHFLNSGKIVIPNLPKENTYMPMNTFREMFMAHCTENNLNKPKWIRTTYEGPFAAMNLVADRQPKKRRYPRPDGPEVTDTWIFGCDLASTNTLSLVNKDTIAAGDAMTAKIKAGASTGQVKRLKPFGSRDDSGQPPAHKPAPQF